MSKLPMTNVSAAKCVMLLMNRGTMPSHVTMLQIGLVCTGRTNAIPTGKLCMMDRAPLHIQGPDGQLHEVNEQLVELCVLLVFKWNSEGVYAVKMALELQWPNSVSQCLNQRGPI